MTMIIDGTNGLTFNNATTQNSGGKVLQVVNATYGTTVTSTNSTNVDTGLTATITPLFTNSKILVFASQNGLAKINNVYMQLLLFRGATQLATFGNAIAYTNSAADNRVGGASMSYLDSPATTSAITYKTQFNSLANGSSVTVQDNNGLSTITLMEISA
jgi:hypothetical protein